MSILAFIGLPGSGKSFGIVQNVVVPNLKKNRTIVTNLPLNAEALRRDLFSPFDALPIHQLTEEEIKTTNLLEKYPGAIFIIDEAQLYFPAGLTESNLPDHHKKFFSMHRHSVCPESGFAAEIVLATQDLSKIAKPVRILVDTTYISRKMSAIGANNHYKVYIYEGMKTLESRGGTPISTIRGKYEKPFTEYYQSHTMAQTGIVANEEKADTRATIWGSGKVRFFLLSFLVLPFVLFFAFKKVTGFISPEEHKSETINEEKQQANNTADNNQFLFNPDLPRAAPLRATTLNQLEPEFDLMPLEEKGARRILRFKSQMPIDSEILGLEPSSFWRLIGYIKKGDEYFHHARGLDQSFRRIPSSDCYFYNQIGEFICTIDEQLVANWTGSELINQPDGEEYNDAFDFFGSKK